MKNKNSDESAFGYGFANERSYQEVKGLTKREYFAGLAMQGLMVQAIAGSHNRDTEQFNREKVTHAINMADELLKQLDK